MKKDGGNRTHAPCSSNSRLIRRSRLTVFPMLSCLARDRGDIQAASAASEISNLMRLIRTPKISKKSAVLFNTSIIRCVNTSNLFVV